MKSRLNLGSVWRLVVRALSPSSVAGSIILPIVVVTVIGGSIAVVVTTDLMLKSAAQSVEIRLDGIATQAAKEIESLLARSYSDVAALSHNPVIESRTAATEEKLAEMQRIQTSYGIFEDVTLVDSTANVIVSTDYKYYGEWATNSVFQTASQGTPSMSDAMILLNPQEVVIQIASPVLDVDSTVASVLIAQMNMEHIWQITDPIRVGRTGYVCLTDRFGNIVAGPYKGQLFEKIAFAPEGSSLPLEHRLLQYDEAGVEMCSVLAPIEPNVPWTGQRWTFAAILPAAEAFAPAHDAETLFWLTIMGLLVLFLAVGLVLGQNLSGKIKILAKGTAEISEGNLRHRLPTLQPKEVGQLANSFNAMAERLENSAAEIARWNAHLEEQVEAKTKELEKIMVGKVQSERLSAMGYLAASVAHELNDPLNSIAAHAQRGLKELDKGQTTEDMPRTLENTSHYLRNIEKELQRSKNIIKKLLSFVRYSKTRDGAIDINQVVSDSLAIASHHLKINRVELLTQLQPELPPARGDAHQLQQVFLSIVLNAQNNMPQGSKLTVETQQRVDGDQPRVEALFTDVGGGIPPESLDRIFEPLFTTAHVGQGIGLDLSLSQDIVRRYGGEIRVKSETGVGTTFIVSLPPADSLSPEKKPNSGDGHAAR